MLSRKNNKCPQRVPLKLSIFLLKLVKMLMNTVISMDNE